MLTCYPSLKLSLAQGKDICLAILRAKITSCAYISLDRISCNKYVKGILWTVHILGKLPPCVHWRFAQIGLQQCVINKLSIFVCKLNATPCLSDMVCLHLPMVQWSKGLSKVQDVSMTLHIASRGPSLNIQNPLSPWTHNGQRYIKHLQKLCIFVKYSDTRMFSLGIPTMWFFKFLVWI